MATLRVASTTQTTSLAGAIAHHVRQDQPVYLQCVGAGAVNQANKAVAVARTFLAQEHGPELALQPEFINVHVRESDTAPVAMRSALLLVVLVLPNIAPEEAP